MRPEIFAKKLFGILDDFREGQSKKITTIRIVELCSGYYGNFSMNMGSMLDGFMQDKINHEDVIMMIYGNQSKNRL